MPMKIRPQRDFEGKALIEGINLKKVVLEGTRFENFTDPTISCEPCCELDSTDSTAVKIIQNKNTPTEGV